MTFFRNEGKMPGIVIEPNVMNQLKQNKYHQYNHFEGSRAKEVYGTIKTTGPIDEDAKPIILPSTPVFIWDASGELFTVSYSEFEEKKNQYEDGNIE